MPWTVSQQFQDPDFPSLSGARIVRIAVHPEMPRAGYGTRWEWEGGGEGGRDQVGERVGREGRGGQDR